jgi:hypothetical protein
MEPKSPRVTEALVLSSDQSRQKFLNLARLNSVYRTACRMFRSHSNYVARQ